MNLNQLRFVLAVAQSASFSRAAEQCCVTQPSLSNAIAQLEDELGGKIFIRTTRQVSLTPLGEHLLPMIEEVLNAKEEVVKAAKSFLNPEHKLIRIGMSPLINSQWVASALEPFQRVHPEVEVVFKQCLLDDLTQRLAQYKVDLAFLLNGARTASQGGCTFYTEPLYYLPNESTGNVGLPDGPVVLSTIANETIMVSKGCGLAEGLRKLFASQGLRMNEYPGQALSYQVLEEWAGLGIGAAVLPRSKLSPENRTACPLYVSNDQPAMFAYNALWNENISQAAHVNDLLRHVKEVMPKIMSGLAV